VFLYTRCIKNVSLWHIRDVSSAKKKRNKKEKYGKLVTKKRSLLSKERSPFGRGHRRDSRALLSRFQLFKICTMLIKRHPLFPLFHFLFFFLRIFLYRSMIPTRYAAGCAGARRQNPSGIFLTNAKNSPILFGSSEKRKNRVSYRSSVYVYMYLAERITKDPVFIVSSRNKELRKEHRVFLFFSENTWKRTEKRMR